MKHIVITPEISNREFLETYVGSARVGLCGGTEFINRAIRKLQWQVTADGRRSPWSHAFMFSERRSDGEFWVLESDLDEASPFKVFSVPASDLTRHAITHYEVLRRTARMALLELRLATGRRHQIRVQLAEIGCPIIGDEKYSARTDPAKRLGLHACRLKFRHPITGEQLQFESPLPPELARLL